MAQTSSCTQLAASAYRVGWICALEDEIIPALDLRDQEYKAPERSQLVSSGGYLFEYGRIGDSNVVFGTLSQYDNGPIHSALIVTHMRQCFRNLEFFVMSGIAGGIPRQIIGEGDDDGSTPIQLGDVIVATPSAKYAGIVAYSQGRERHERFERTGWMDKIPIPLRQATSKLGIDQRRKVFRLKTLLEQEVKTQKYSRPKLPDKLYNASYQHKSGSDQCKNCSETELVERALREEPRCHFGQVLSGTALIIKAARRDELADEYPGAYGIEMEGAGLDEGRCLIIKGISDYADSHKNDAWKRYAAANSAAVVKHVLKLAQFPHHMEEQPLPIPQGV